MKLLYLLQLTIQIYNDLKKINYYITQTMMQKKQTKITNDSEEIELNTQ